MKAKKRNAKLARLLSLMLVALIGYSAVWAWNIHQINQENNLQSRTVSVEVNENFPDPTVEEGAAKTKQVSFKNTGAAAAFVRVSYVENWETNDALLEGDGGVQKNWTSAWTSDWMSGEDGWYYYKKVLPAGASTADILKGVTFPETVFEGADYSLDFMVETVQVSDQAEVNTSATEKLFGKKGTVSNASIANGAVIAGSVSWI